MRHALLIGLWGCSTAVEAPVSAEWTGTPEHRMLPVNAHYDVASAAVAGLAAGAVHSETDPDLSGTWTTGTELTDKIRLSERIERRREQPGVYTLKSTLYMVARDVNVMQVKLDVIEVIGGGQQCQFTRSVTVSYASEGLQPSLEPIAAELTPDALNLEPCRRIEELSVDRVRGTDPDGVAFLETRVKP